MKKSNLSQIEFIEYEKKDLTRIDPATKFVIKHSSGRIIYVFRETKYNEIVQKLIDSHKIESVSDLRKNRYGDLLIIK